MLAWKSADVAAEVLAWYKVARAARWESLADVRRRRAALRNLYLCCTPGKSAGDKIGGDTIGR